MLVKPSQLIPGCVLIKDVNGKTNRPIIAKNTVLSDELIEVLQKFLIPTVEVSKKLKNGDVFKPANPIDEKEFEPKKTNIEKRETSQLSFVDHYLEVVQKYKRLFHSWQFNTPINMPNVRKLMIPLLEQIEGIGIDIFKLHHYSSDKDYFYHHSISVALISAFLAKKLGYKKGEWIQIGLAGLLSDCGMSQINSKILNKHTTLNYREIAEVKKHPKYSYHLVKSITTITKEVKLAIVQHHERLDGSGYPYQLKGDKIHKYARIIAVSDTYHAMTCERGYQEKQSPFKVIKELKQAKFTGLDPVIVQTLVRHLVNLSVGSKVLLSNDMIGEIIFIDERSPINPMVQLDITEEIINLEHDSSIYVKDIL